MKNRLSITIRVVTAILAVAFLIQDIAWAYPFEGNKNLAVTGLKNPQTLRNLKTAMLGKLKNSPNNITLWDEVRRNPSDAGLNPARKWRSKEEGPESSATIADSKFDPDITNAFIRNHIDQGGAIEIDENKETVELIRRDGASLRSPDIERHFKINNIFSKIKEAKNPSLLRRILLTRSNFRNLSPKEQEKIIRIIQASLTNFILGNVIIHEDLTEADTLCVFGHARIGKRHGLGPAVWIGEILFNRLTVEQRAQFFLEEAQHIFKPGKKHGKIDKAKNPKEIIEHDEGFISIIDVSPATSDEFAASAINIINPESPNMTKRPQAMDYRRAESVYKDYFEAVFEFNLELFVLMAKRMKAKRLSDDVMLEDAKADTEKWLNKIDKEIKSFEERLKGLPEDSGMIDSHNIVKEQFIRARELIGRNNESAANAVLISALNTILTARDAILKAKISMSSREVKVSEEGGQIVMWQQRYIRPHEDARTLIPAYTKIPFDLRWQAGRSLDEQEERILGEGEEIIDYIERIGAIQKIAENEPSGLAAEDIDHIISGLGTVIVEERRLASITLNAAGRLAEIGSPADVKQLLPIAKRYLKLRIEDIDSILDHLRTGRVEPFRDIVTKNNKDFIGRVRKIKRFMENGDDERALGNIYGLWKKIKPYLGEPDFDGLSPMIWPAIFELKSLKETDKKEAHKKIKARAEFWINLVEKKLENSQYLNEFMSLFREEYVTQRLAGNKVSLKEDTFDRVFEDFIKSKQLIRGSPQTKAFRMLCYLAAFVPLEVKNPSKTSEKIANPLFKAISALYLMTDIDNIAKILTVKRLSKLSKTLATLKGFRSKEAVNNLSPDEEHAQLVKAIAEDYGVAERDLRNALPPENPESPNMAKRKTAVLSVKDLFKKVLALDGEEIIDNEGRYFTLDVKKKERDFYPIVITIRKKTHNMPIGTIKLNIKHTLSGDKYTLDLGLAHIKEEKYKDRSEEKEYQGKGIFTRVFSLVSEIMPPDSELCLLALEETDTLKALARGETWLKTRMGGILDRCGWEPETISIYSYPKSSTTVLFDKNNRWPGSYDPRGFETILGKAIEDIDETELVKDAVVCVYLTKIAGWAGFKEDSDAEGLPGSESANMAKTRPASNNIVPDIESMLKTTHEAVRSGIDASPFPEGSKVLLSSNLFEEMDLYNLKNLLSGKNVEILDPQDIKRRATNNKVEKDKMVIVLTKGEFGEIWRGLDETLWIRSSVLLLDDKLTGSNYLYLEGVIGLAKAIMSGDRQYVAALYKILFGMELDPSALTSLDEKNAIAFALKAILKFKPIEINSKQLDGYKVMMEDLLLSA